MITCDLSVSTDTTAAHRQAAGKWGAPSDDGCAYLHQITHPTLVVNGHTDIFIATVNSFILQQHLPNAHLIPYPDSGHGADFQYPERFMYQVSAFPDD